MKKFFVLSLGLVAAMATACVTGTAQAEEAATADHVKSGPQGGDHLGPFTVTKIAGAEDDGVAEGKKLCYRCKNGSRPQVVIFTRSTGPEVAALVAKLDAAMVEHEGEKLACFVNVMGENPEAAAESAKKFAMTSKAKHIPFVVPNEFENGPDDYGINPKAEVTVTFATDGTVTASHGFASASEVCLDTCMADLAAIVK
ncbi:hypothetical protein Poly51_08330 [Rubripirellula tenax]|uniref:Secreted protein n=1 Tax=Rubripirellula tenax TaxID=2528015 RepID=A0A5C6FFG9_9BACT|nr:hypothetical protein [Rubripirellula tenax]TWU60556.1 hypothetical protein Poly51_08330 [Rubripirellula tenax]